MFQDLQYLRTSASFFTCEYNFCTVVEARGWLRAEVLPILRHHEPADEPLRRVGSRDARDLPTKASNHPAGPRGPANGG